jgi:N-acetylglucosamine-6-phosphate deacetylase
MACTTSAFQSQKAPCGRILDGQHVQDQDGSICERVVRHDGKVLVDELVEH